MNNQQIKFPVGSHVLYNGVVKLKEYGRSFRTMRRGRVVEYHQGNKKNYEILPDGGHVATERVAERDIVGYVDKLNEFWVKNISEKSTPAELNFDHDELIRQFVELIDIVRFLLEKK